MVVTSQDKLHLILYVAFKCSLSWSSFATPSHIRSFELKNWNASTPIETFCRAFSNTEKLIVPLQSKELMVTLINRLECPECGQFLFDDCRVTEDISIEWFHQNIHHKTGRSLTYRVDDNSYSSSIRISIKNENNSFS